ncbi:MAG: hypothetical protein ACK5ZG_02270 [Phycisphaerae bacterium]|jgi:hypothetical protein
MQRPRNRSVLSCAHAALAAASTLALSHVAFAQCTKTWLEGQPVRGVIGGPSLATTWDPDGPGPAAQLLVLAGRVLHAGNTPSWIVTTWNGTSFQPLTPGPIGASSACNPGSLCAISDINALTVFQGDLVIAGQFSVGNSFNSELNIARWTGTQWEAVGTGLAPDVNRGLPFRILSLGVWQNTLIAACSDGSYILTNGVWTRFGPRRVDDVRDYAVFNGDLFRAGALPGSFVSQEAVERWNGTAWEGVWDTSVVGFGYDLFEFNNQLHVVARNSIGSFITSAVFRWLGGSTWEPVGPAINGIADNAEVFGSEIYVTGQFAGDLSGTLATNIMRLDAAAQTWQPIGPALPRTSSPGIAGIVNDIAVFDNKLFVVGDFTLAGETSTSNVIAWNGTAWASPLATGGTGPVRGVAVADGKTYVAGRFGAFASVNALNVAVNDGSGWQQAGDGFDGGIDDLTSFGDTAALISSNGTNARVFALEDGAWTQLGAELPNPTGFIPIGFVEELADGLYASTLVSSTPLYKWDGASWNVAASALTPFASVYDVTRFNGQLVVGGNSLVESNGSVFASCVGIVNESNQISVLGVTEEDAPLLTGIVQAVEVYNGELYAAGSELRLSGSTAFIGSIARWTGTTWVPVGGGVTGVSGPGFISDMQVIDTELVIAGFFSSAGNNPVRNIAAWNGTTWRSLGLGIGQQVVGVQVVGESVAALAVRGDTLLAGGFFATADGRPSAFFAEWGCAPAGCDSIDFNRNDVFPEDQDVIDFFNVLSGAPCPYSEPCDIDFNNNAAFPEDQDVIDFFTVLSGGLCST